MALADEQGVHPFTQKWWERLPEKYQQADRVQGFRRSEAWHGLNRDPRFVTGHDGWHRVNVSGPDPYKATVSFQRTFRATPNVPVHVRTFHRPQPVLDEAGDPVGLPVVGVRHRIENHTGTVQADEFVELTGTVRQSHHVVVTPDRWGILRVVIEVTLGIPQTVDWVDAVHVGPQDVTFEELPSVDYFATAAAYPLLRFMDGIGHQAGFLSDMASDMHQGRYTDPRTAPEHTLTFLAAVMGVPSRYARKLTMPKLREHLTAIVEGTSPAAGSRDLIALTAQQYLTGTKQVAVMPAHAYPGFATTDPLHTLIVLARADEVPPGGLAGFEAFLNAAGVIPAGHRVVVRSATQSWDSWEAATGPSWAEYENQVKTWNDNDSIGVNL